MSQESRWQEQFYPGTQVYRNLLDIRDAGQLHDVESVVVAERTRELLERPELVEHSFDVEHLQAIHRHLFQDVYAWAGEFRAFDMSKLGGQGFAFQPDGVREHLERAFDVVAEVEWERLDQERFPRAMAWVYAELNYAHPFPEGNGRTGKLFLEHVAARSEFRLDFSRVDPAVWSLASELSMPEPPTWEPNPVPLVEVFETATEPRHPVQALAMRQAVLVRQLESIGEMSPVQAQSWLAEATSSMRALGRLEPGTRELPELTETARRLSGVEARTITERAWPFDSYQQFMVFEELYGSFTRAVDAVTRLEGRQERSRGADPRHSIHHGARGHDPVEQHRGPGLQL
ncbi:MAG: Fic family protein [Propionibacteriaceae bacterium]|nr:Fic family protein [Propionibacteriaceae bacterium]